MADETETSTGITPESANQPQPTAAVPLTTNEAPDDWSPAKVDEETGIALDGHDLPLNHRLRAEALADAGETSDPADTVSPELIADAADRLERERRATPPVSANMKVKDLETIASREGVDISGAKNNAERVAMIEDARAGVAPPPPPGNEEETE